MLRILILTVMFSVFAPARAHIAEARCQAYLTWKAVSRAPIRHKERIDDLVQRIGYVSPVWMAWNERRNDGHRYQGVYALGPHIILPRMMPGNRYRIGLWNRPPMSSGLRSEELWRTGLLSMQAYHIEVYKEIFILVTEVQDLHDSFDLMHTLNLYTAVALTPSAHLLQLRTFVRPGTAKADYQLIQRMKADGRHDLQILSALEWRGIGHLMADLEFPLKDVAIAGLRRENGEFVTTNENPDEWEIRLFFALP